MESKRENMKGKHETWKNSLTDEQLPDEFKESPISKLPVEMLISIFSLLPIPDRVRIQRVCKFWRAVSLKSWSSCQNLDSRNEDWGSMRVIDSNVIENVLKLCGPYVKRIGCSTYRFDHNTTLREVTMIANKYIFSLMKNLCPNLTAIDMRDVEITDEGLEYLAKNYSELTEFAMYYYSVSVNFNKTLSLLFRNNKKLRRVLLNALRVNCLLDLNPIAIEEILIEYDFWECKEIISTNCKALQRFINLQSLSLIMHYISDDGDDMDNLLKMLEAIEPGFEKLKELNICTLSCPVEDTTTIINSINFKCLSNLQKLSLKGDKETELKIDCDGISKYCTKLTVVKLIEVSATDLQIECIIKLLELQELDFDNLDEITDAIFINHVSWSSLKILRCASCSQLTSVGFCELLQNSPESLQKLTITDCKKVDLEKVVEGAKKATDSRSNGIMLRMFVKKVYDRMLYVYNAKVHEKVTKLSKYLELTEYYRN